MNERVALLLALLGVCVVSMNATQFVTQFPAMTGVAPAHAAITNTLPERAERAETMPVAPLFLDTVTAQSFYVSREKPDPQLLLQYNAYESMPLASLTKLMTALVVLDNEPEWGRKVRIMAGDIKGGSRSILRVGSEVTVDDLWVAMLVGSDNDAATALSRVVAGSEDAFVVRMNERAASMSLQQTKFTEPSGLHAGNVSTAREFALLARMALHNDRIKDTLARDSANIVVSGRQVNIYNTDQRIRYVSDNDWQFSSGKTGYTNAAQYTSATLLKTADGSENLIVLLGSDSDTTRVDDVVHLARWAIHQSR